MPFLCQFDNERMIGKNELVDEKYSIGKKTSCDIVLPEKRVSGLHAYLYRNADKYVIEDNDSTNGVLVNGKIIKTHTLTDRDKIEIGTSYLVYYEAVPEDFSLVQETEKIISKPELMTHTTFLKDQLGSIMLSSSTGSDIAMKAKMDQVIETALNELYALYEVGKTITMYLDVDRVLDILMDQAIKLTGAKRGIIILIDDESGEMHPSIKRKVDGDGKLCVSTSIIKEVIKTRQPVLTENTKTDSRFNMKESVIAFDISSVICTPIICQDSLLGIIYLEKDTSEGSYQNKDLNFLSALANHAAIAIINAKLYRDMKNEERIKTNLSRFFSPSVVQAILEKKEDLSLGGSIVEATVLFSDIRNFTKISARVSPEQILNQLNEYFSVMIDILFKYGGTLDKLVGDAIMAVFNSPVALEDAPYKAVCCAVEMYRTSLILQEEWKKRGWELFEIGIGLNTGNVIAGNVGSEKRMEYTVIGDVVNVASRIEGMNKDLGTHILVSEDTHKKLNGRLITEKHENVMLRGKSSPVVVYSLDENAGI